MNKFFITGGSGFVGSNLVKSLVDSNHEVSVYDDFSRGNLGRLKKIEKKIRIFSGDVRNQEELLRSSKGHEYFIHLAAINGTKFFYEKPQDVLDVAIRGMLNAVNVCKTNNIKNFLFASSSETYQNPKIFPTPEKIPLIVPDVFNPRYSYGSGKIISEMIALHYYQDFFKKMIIFRPHNVYGPDMGVEHVIPELIGKILNSQKKINIKGNGDQTRAFIYIDDFISALNLLIFKGKSKEIYNIGNSEEIKIKDLTEKIINLINSNIKIETSSAPKGETNRRCPNNDKIIKLGYKQKITINHGLKKVINWYKSQHQE